VRLTESQRRAIEHRGSSLLVSASAGAGKTEVLARRCAALVADPQRPCGVERLLVVTFTRAAAAELRLRVARMLREQADRATDATLREHLRRQELLVGAADIGTIDAWCGRIVREHFAEAGVDPVFTTLSEEDAHLLRGRVLDELLTWVHQDATPLAQAARRWIACAAVPDDTFLRQLVARLNAFRDQLVDPQAWFAQRRAECASDDAAAVLSAALQEECRFQHDQLQVLLTRLSADEVALLQPYVTALADWGERLKAADRLDEVVADIDAFNIGPVGRGRRNGGLTPTVADVRQRWLELRLKKTWSPATVAGIVQHAAATRDLLGTLLDLEARYQQMLQAVKQTQATYEFGDVLRLALDLLGRPSGGPHREPTDIARRLQGRYEHILVDEYQDTSAVQVEILRLVTRRGRGRSNCFMVGDVKQSIYGFREAEPRLFVEQAEAFLTGREEGRVEYLSDNFRSQADLLAALNDVFAELFDPELGGTEYGPQQRLRAGRASSEIRNPTLDASPRVQLHLIEHDTREDAAASDDGEEVLQVERIEREAQLAADQIRSLLQAGVQIPERQPDGTVGLRPLRLNDIVILLRSAVQTAGQVARVLRLNGVPCLAGARESLLEAVEVQDICNVLRLLVNRRQDVPLAAYLRSPLAALTEAELRAVRAACPHPHADLYVAVRNYCRQQPRQSLAARLEAALNQLDRWAEAAREEDLPSLLRRILTETGLVLLTRGLRGGEQRVALLRALQTFALQFSRGGGTSADGFVEYLEELARQELYPTALAAGQDDLVRIMTIHGAKGLEFPVVFLLGAGTRFNRQRQNEALQCDERLGLGLRFADYSRRAILTSARHQVIRGHLARRELAEELRLLYVAATRARELLLITGHIRPGQWDQTRTMFAHLPTLPLISRLNVDNRLEWLLMAAARQPAQRLQIVTHAATDLVVSRPGRLATGPATSVGEWSVADQNWVERGVQLVRTDVASVWADYPAALSVNAAKELALRESGADQPRVLDSEVYRLPTPTFAADDNRIDGRTLGVVCHRFLEHADCRHLGSAAEVTAQVQAQVASGQLTPEQGALVPIDEVVWFAGTSEGRLLATQCHAARREVPFVYALPVGDGEHTIIRGIIDCLIETPDGLVILDYKTDRASSTERWEQRLAGYQVQLRVYAQAAAAVFNRPVTHAALVFLLARRIVTVAPRPLTADLLGGHMTTATHRLADIRGDRA